ncbi:MAG: hypothetical protein AMS25_02730 [Gemmatimonas sp. SM23_52]|nr:MAG: hypothetical protein AMS25_02730 [Gemmatimonas sp. SM23_52]
MVGHALERVQRGHSFTGQTVDNAVRGAALVLDKVGDHRWLSLCFCQVERQPPAVETRRPTLRKRAANPAGEELGVHVASVGKVEQARLQHWSLSSDDSPSLLCKWRSWTHSSVARNRSARRSCPRSAPSCAGRSRRSGRYGAPTPSRCRVPSAAPTPAATSSVGSAVLVGIPSASAPSGAVAPRPVRCSSKTSVRAAWWSIRRPRSAGATTAASSSGSRRAATVTRLAPEEHL